MKGEMVGNGIIQSALRAQAQPMLQVAAPLNDVQLVALIAANIYANNQNALTPATAVATAIELVTETIAQCKEKAKQ